MIDQDKNSFVKQDAFKKYYTYWLWIKITSWLIVAVVAVLGYLTFSAYRNNQKLLATKNELNAYVGGLDELVRKKNKLLSIGATHAKHDKRKHSLHAKIAQYLDQIENALTVGVYLDSFEFTLKKIELTGYSQDIFSLSSTIAALQKLAFVKQYELDQVSKNNKNFSNKLAFTITLEL